jgi:signal peptidase II
LTDGTESGDARPRYVRLLLTAALVLLVDQVTKEMALRWLEDGPFDIVSGAITLRLAYNSGGAFGILSGMPGVFLLATLAVVALILVWVRSLEDARWIVPLGLIVGGGLGNVTDRVVRDLDGRVVDFVDLHVWPVFNVADMAIVTGVGLLIIFGSRDRGRE